VSGAGAAWSGLSVAVVITWDMAGHRATASSLSVSSNVAPWRRSRACGSAYQRPHTGPQ